MKSMNLRIRRYAHWILAVSSAFAVGCSAAGDATELPSSSGEQQQALSCRGSMSREDRVESGRWITSKLDYDGVTGEANVTTTVSNSRSLVGWTGGVAIAFVDSSGTLLYMTSVHTRGVDACAFRCPRTSTLNWSDTVPAVVRGQVAGAAILHAHTPTNRAGLNVLKFLADTKPGCILAPGVWAEACKIVADVAKATEPELAKLTEQKFQEVVTALGASIPERISMFAACPGTGADLVPAMTGPTTPSGTVSSSGIYGGGYEGWQAFDSDNSTLWLSNMSAASVSLGYEWGGGVAKTVTSYEVDYNNGSCCEQRGPKDWALQGWDGTSWITVDTVRGQSGWYSNNRRSFAVDAPGSYSKYRLYITADNYNNPSYPVTLVSISSIHLY
jgi:hypothetical protein